MFRKLINYLKNVFEKSEEEELDYVNYHDAYMSQLINNINNKNEEKNK